MSTIQTNGSSLTPNGFGSFLEVNNAHGTIKSNGTVSSSVVESVPTVIENVGVFASTVIEDTVTDGDYAHKALSGGTFANNNTKPISSLITTELAGVTTNVIKTPGNDGDAIRSIHKIESIRTRRLTSAIRDNKFNRYSGDFDAGFPVNALDTFYNISEDNTIMIDGVIDEAANPSLNEPGELTYMRGGKNPHNDNYKKKTN